MKRYVIALLVCFVLALPALSSGQTCVKIQSGLLVYAAGNYLEGQPITTGVNPYGYNYQAHSFNGTYFNAYAARAGFPPYDGDDAAYLAANPAAASHWAWPYRADELAMKWNDAWLSNQDCDNDGLLDRHFGFTSYLDSGAWLTNHDSWKALDAKNREVTVSEFIKIVANSTASVIVDSPVDPNFEEGTVFLNGKKVGPQIWGEMAVIQWVMNDRSTGKMGLRLKSDLAAGFGFFKQ